MKDDVTTIHDPIIWRHKLGTSPYEYFRGVVFTKMGIVAFYQQAKDPPRTTLFFVWRGKDYRRNIGAFYSERYTITLARRFAEEIVKAHPACPEDIAAMVAQIEDLQEENRKLREEIERR